MRLENRIGIAKHKLNYVPHKAQKEIHQDKHRFRVAVCGRRFGKTTLALAELVFSALIGKPKSLNWYVAPTYRQAKQVAWRMLQEMLSPDFIIRRNEMELSLTLFNESVIELKGADNYDSLRGVGLDFVVLDEYASMKPSVWQEIIRPEVIDREGRAIFIGTPRGYNHFYDIYMMGQERNELSDPDYKSFRRPTSDNPFIAKEEIEKARKELSEEAYAQEFLADFRHHTGRVYKDFDRAVHVIPPFDTPSSWIYGRYLDRGWRVPTGVGFLAIDEKDNWYIIDEIYETGLTNPQLAEMIKAKTKENYFWHSYADSAQASDIEDLNSMGLSFLPVKKLTLENKGDFVRSGIERISERLAVRETTGKPKLFIFANCVNHINEFENYEWDERRGKEESERPKKKNDHLLDGLRYFAMMYKTSYQEETSGEAHYEEERPKNWSFS